MKKILFGKSVVMAIQPFVVGFLIWPFLISSSVAYADYPAALINQNVCSEIADDNDRKIPRSDWFCAALDSQAFLRFAGINDFYHGFGHWTQLRSEFQINPVSKLNVRSIFYSGSSSEGYAAPNGFTICFRLLQNGQHLF